MILGERRPSKHWSERRHDDPPTAGSLWDEALAADSHEGIELLEGLDSDAPARVTKRASRRNLSTGYYQPPQIDEIVVGGRRVYRTIVGYFEGYAVTYHRDLIGAERVFGWDE